MGGVQTNIEEHFREKYEELFNSADDGAELTNVQLQTDTKVDVESLKHVAMVTPDINSSLESLIQFSPSLLIASRMVPNLSMINSLPSFRHF